jgi:hypothetical protein
MRNIYLKYSILSFINSFLFLVIPLYIVWYWIFILLAITGLIATIVIDIMNRTDNWKTVIKILGFVVFSYVLGIVLMRVFDVEQGFPN